MSKAIQTLSPAAKAIYQKFFADSAAAFNQPAGDRLAGQTLDYSTEQALAYMNRIALSSERGAAATFAAQNFAATPTREQTAVLQPTLLANPFLSSLPMIPVTNIIGEKVLVGVSTIPGSRTDTSGNGERTPQELVSTGTQNYDLAFTEFDFAIGYNTIDSWAKFGPNRFYDLYMTAMRNAISRSMLQVGWRGTSAASATNRTNNPLLQDVNKGWLQKIREFNSASQYAIGTVGSPITISASGGTATYKNLDTAVSDAKHHLAEYCQGEPGLVALISRNLVNSQENSFYSANGGLAMEKAALAANNNTITKNFGGLPTIIPPFFPDGTILVTSLDNLAIYYQDTSVRRLQRDWAPKNSIQDFNSMNLGYVVQDELCSMLVENITLVA